MKYYPKFPDINSTIIGYSSLKILQFMIYFKFTFIFIIFFKSILHFLLSKVNDMLENHY